MNKLKRIIPVTAIFLAAALSVAACGKKVETTTAQTTAETTVAVTTETTEAATSEITETTTEETTQAETEEKIEGNDLFSSRDLTQKADLSEAKEITLSDGSDVEITEAGVYVISGDASEVTIKVDVDKENDKVQLVLNGVTITNTDAPAIYVVAADKVFVTTAEGTENELKVTGVFEADGSTNLDGAIYSKDDLVLNGLGTLTINSSANAIVGKDDVKVTGGTYEIKAVGHGIEAKDSLLICGGDFTITAGKDGLHCANDDDTSVGSIYVSGGSFVIDADGQALQAITTITIDDGQFNINAKEGMEATYIQINGGTIDIYATDDGINATQASYDYDVVIEVNGGTITVEMGSGDTDGFDANGSIIINGGYVDVTGQSTFDYDVSGVINGGTVICNGEQVDTLPQSMMGGGGRGGRGGF